MGMGRSGKSSLVNVFVNNIFDGGYTPNTEPKLFYTTMRIADENETSFSALLELEDTFASDGPGKLPGCDSELSKVEFFDLYWPSSKQLDRDTAVKAKEAKEKKATDRAPMGMHLAPTDGAYRPLTRNRMAYLLVFDASCKDSLNEAFKLHAELTVYLQKHRELAASRRQLTPIIYFVANKIDLLDDTDRVVVDNATSFTNSHGIPFVQVSALQYKGVKKLFRSVVQSVRGNQHLWKVEGVAGEIDVGGSRASGCVVQ